MTATTKELQLLFFIKNEYNGTMTAISKVSQDYQHLGMNVMRSLQRKGLVNERDSFFEITDLGTELLSKSKEPLPPLTTPVLMYIFNGILQFSDDKKVVESIVNDAIKKYINPKHEAE